MLEYGNRLPCNTKISILQYRKEELHGTVPTEHGQVAEVLGAAGGVSLRSFSQHIPKAVNNITGMLVFTQAPYLAVPERVTHDVLPHLSSKGKVKWRRLAVSASYKIGTKKCRQHHNISNATIHRTGVLVGKKTMSGE